MQPDVSGHHDVIVIGAGPAGMACAATAARGGARVLLVDQRPGTGGAIFRQPAPGVKKLRLARAQQKLWSELSAALTGETSVTTRFNHLYVGLDADGNVMLENRATGEISALRCAVLCLATGGVERVLPRPGWTLPGVSTAGGLQVMVKETGVAPGGRLLLAGSGPLLLAVAAQMTRLGQPPVAILEAGNPLRQPTAAIGLMRWPALWAEAIGYSATILAARVPWHRGAEVQQIRADGKTLTVSWTDAKGHPHDIEADRVALHDGITENAFGLPQTSAADPATGHPAVLRLGDCRLALGSTAAARAGTAAANLCLSLLAGAPLTSDELIRRIGQATQSQAEAQEKIAAVFAPVATGKRFASLPDDTVLCRCEDRTLGTLRELIADDPGISGRELKLNGRFAMGACQGRFCAANTAAALSELTGATSAMPVSDITGQRWPIRPVPISSLIRPDFDPAAHADEVTK